MIAYVLKEMVEFKNSEIALKCIKQEIRNFCQKINSKWEQVARHRQRFLDTYSSWLNENITFPDNIFKTVLSTSTPDNPTIGRPTKPFIACSLKAKKLKVQHLLQSTSQELSTATEITLRKEGKRDFALIVKELCCISE